MQLRKKKLLTPVLGCGIVLSIANNAYAQDQNKCPLPESSAVRQLIQSNVFPVYTRKDEFSRPGAARILEPNGSVVIVGRDESKYYGLSAAHVFPSDSKDYYIAEPTNDQVGDFNILSDPRNRAPANVEIRDNDQDFVLVSFQFRQNLSLEPIFFPLAQYFPESEELQENVYVVGWEKEITETDKESNVERPAFFRCPEGSLVDAATAADLFAEANLDNPLFPDIGDFGYTPTTQPGTSGGAVIYEANDKGGHLVGIHRSYHDGISTTSILDYIEQQDQEIYALLQDKVVDSPSKSGGANLPLGTDKSYLGVGGVFGNSTDNAQDETFWNLSVQSRFNLAKTPFSFRNEILLLGEEQEVATSASLSLDLAIARKTNLYFGAGYSFISTEGIETSVGDRSGAIFTFGGEIDLGDPISIYADTKLGLNTDSDDDSSVLSFRLGLGYQF